MTTRSLRLYVPLLVLCALLFSKAAIASAPLRETFSATLPSGFAVTVKRIRVAADGTVYALGTSSTALYKISADGTSVTTTNYSVSIPASSTADFSVSGNTLYLATTAGLNGRILRFDVTGTTAALVASVNATGTGSIALLPTGGNPVYTSRSAVITQYDTTLSTTSNTSSVFSSISRMAVTRDNILYYLSTSGNLNRSTDFTSATEISLITGLGNSVSANSLVISPDASAAYIGYSTSIRKYSLPVSASPSLLWTKSYSNNLAGMDVDSSGNIITAQYNGIMSVYSPINAPSSFSAATSSGNTINLSWTTGVSDGDFAGVTIRGSTATYPTSPTDGTTVVTDNTVDTSFLDTGLSPATTYYYTIFNKTLDGFYSSGVTANTMTPPSTPTLVAEKPTPNGTVISLSWDAPTGTDHFTLQRETDAMGYTNVSSNVSSSITAFYDSGLSDGSYVYRIYAVDAFGNSSDAGISSALIIDTAAPSSPNLSAEKPTPNGTVINLSWDVPFGTDHFMLQREKDAGGYVNVSSNFSDSITAFYDTGLSDGSYAYRIYAVDAFGNSSDAGTSAALVIDTTAPSAPTLAAEKPTPNGTAISLSWNTPSGTDHFALQREKDAGGYVNVSSNVSSSMTTFYDGGLSDGSYVYRIYAVDAFGNSSDAGSSSALVVDSAAPSAPTLVAEKPTPTGTAINLSWDAPLGTDHFVLQRNKDGEGYTNVNTHIESSTTTLSDTALTDGAYVYRIYAVDAFGNSSDAGTSSELIIDTTPPEPPTSVAADVDGMTILLTWINPVSDFDAITIRSSTSDFPTSISDGTFVADNLTETSFEDEDVEPGTYYYSLFAEDAVGNISVAANVTVVNTGVTPTVSTGDAEDIDDISAILMGMIDDIGTSDVTTRGFELGETTSYDFTAEEDGAFTAGEFELAVSDLDCGTLYHYRVFAINETGTAYGQDETFATSACADASQLVITVQAPTSAVQVNATTVFVVIVDNSGTSDRDNTVLSFTLSENIAFVSADIIVMGDESDIDASTSESVSCTGTNPVSCDIGVVPANASVTLNVTVQALSTGPMSLAVTTEDGESTGGSATTTDGGGVVNASSGSKGAGCALNTTASDSSDVWAVVGSMLVSALLLLSVRWRHLH